MSPLKILHHKPARPNHLIKINAVRIVGQSNIIINIGIYFLIKLTTFRMLVWFFIK